MTLPEDQSSKTIVATHESAASSEERAEKQNIKSGLKQQSMDQIH